MADLIYWAMALIFVIALILGLSLLMKRFIAMNSGAGSGLFGKIGERRLKVVEILPLDQKSRLVLISRDNETEHLILQSQTGDLVIERGITPNQNGEQSSIRETDLSTDTSIQQDNKP